MRRARCYLLASCCSATMAIAIGCGDDGGTASGTQSATPTGTECEMEATFQGCAGCHCISDIASCESYNGLTDTHIYCGAACPTSCTAYCESVMFEDPNPDLIDDACRMCATGLAADEPDIEAFNIACAADMGCTSFSVMLMDCPAP